MRSAIVLLYNDCRWIAPQLYNIYDHVDEIIIVDGADHTSYKINGSIASNDGSLDYIECYPDPDKKIKVHNPETTVSKNEKVKIANQMTDPRSTKIYSVDLDEFFHAETIEQNFDLLDEHQNVETGQLWFYKWPDMILATPEQNNRNIKLSPVRFFQNLWHTKRLMISHIPQRGYVSEQFGYIQVNAHVNNEKLVYHYLALHKDQLQKKMIYYANRGDCSMAIAERRINEFDKIKRFDHVDSYQSDLIEYPDGYKFIQ